jgi:hypothetical protein
MNNTKTIIKHLKLYNKWRRSDEKMEQPNPTEIGKLIDEACEVLTSLERERDKARDALREVWQSGDAFLPHVDQTTTNRWRKAAGWDETK